MIIILHSTISANNKCIRLSIKITIIDCPSKIILTCCSTRPTFYNCTISDLTAYILFSFKITGCDISNFAILCRICITCYLTFQFVNIPTCWTSKLGCTCIILHPDEFCLAIIMPIRWNLYFFYICIFFLSQIVSCCIDYYTNIIFCFTCHRTFRSLNIAAYWADKFNLTGIIFCPDEFCFSIAVLYNWNFYFFYICIFLSFESILCCINCFSCFGARWICSFRLYLTLYCLYIISMDTCKLRCA